MLKHGKKSRNIDYHGLELFFPRLIVALNQIDFSDKKTLEYLRVGLNFIFTVGNITNLEEIIQHSNQLPEEPKGEVMTIAEQLIQWGRDESADALRQAEAKSADAIRQAEEKSAQARADAQAEAQAEKQQIALNLLRNGLDIEFVSQNTKIDVETLNRLLREDAQKAQH